MYNNNLFIIKKNHKEIYQLKYTLISHFQTMNQGPVIYYLKLYIIRDVIIGTIFFFSEIYIQKILKYYNMQNLKGIDTFITKKDILIYVNPSYYIESLIIT